MRIIASTSTPALQRGVRAGMSGLLMLTVASAAHGPVLTEPSPADVTRAFAATSTTVKPTSDATVNLLDKRGKIVVNSKTYAIYWGKQADFPTDLRRGMTNLLSGLNRSTYLSTINEYMRGKTATTKYVRSFVDTSRPPTVDPTPSVILAEVRKVLRATRTKPDSNAVYLVFSSNLPKADYCAWHAAGEIAGVQTQVAYVPNSAGTTACYPADNFANVTPYSFGTRSIADNAVHELLEAMTDPIPQAGWIDSDSNEIGDKCDFVYSAPVVLNGDGNVWQLQSQWSNRNKQCIQVATSDGGTPGLQAAKAT